MQHPDHDDLALIALGEGLGDTVDAHVAGCQQCSTEVDTLRMTVDLADLSNFGEDAVKPGEHVWQSIVDELGFSTSQQVMSGVATATELPGQRRTTGPTESAYDGATVDGVPPGGPAEIRGDGRPGLRSVPTGDLAPPAPTSIPPRTTEGAQAPPLSPPVPVVESTTGGSTVGGPTTVVPFEGGRPPGPTSDAPSAGRRRNRWAVPLAAAVIGIALGAGAVAILQNRTDEVTVEATAPLTPVPAGPLGADGQQQLGTAEIVAAAAGQQVRVQAADLPPTNNDYEVWLFGNDGKMVSLGTLDNGSGTFTVPQGISTQEYRVIDVSDEPPDGVPTHSGVSLVRGQFS